MMREGGRECEAEGGREAFLKVWEEERAWEWVGVLTMPQVVVTAWSLKAVGYWCASPLVARAFKEAVEGGREGGAGLTDTEAASLLHSLRCIGLDVSEYPPLVLLRGERGGLSSFPSSSSSSSFKAGRGGRGGGGSSPSSSSSSSSSPVMLLTRGRARQKGQFGIPTFSFSGEDDADAEEGGRERRRVEEEEDEEEEEERREEGRM